ncbi:MAG: GAF domain-containing protein, partial [Elusimicrobia bacterium]|nr:GAF domain-containing protein [Elusimicrobiota bacterium]
RAILSVMATGGQQTEHFELLLEVGRLLSSKIELDELLTAVMQLAARVVDAETASLLLVDLATDELYFHVALGLDPQLAKLRLKMGQGIAGTVAQTAKPLIINDARKDPRWNSKMDEDSGFVTRSILAAPITLKGRCIGVVEAINHVDGDFSFTDLRVFEAFASQAAVAIENARLFASLKEQNATLDTLLNEIRDAALLTDGRGGVRVANAAAKQFLSGAARVDEALSGFAVAPAISEIMAARDPLVAFEAVRELPQRLVLAGTASLIRDARTADVKGRVVVFRDVTEERREEGLKRNFLSLISHKLKTPLSAINGYSQLLFEDARKKPESEFLAKSLKTILAQGQKLARLVDKLLNYTVLEELDEQALAKKPFDAAAVAAKAVDALQPELEERGAKVTVEAAPDLRPVGDEGLVLEVLKNLIENAVKFSRAPVPEARVSVRRAAGGVELRVADNGPGLPPEERARVFEKFYQVDASFTGQVEGWGLGLPFVKRVIERLDGTVRCEAAPPPAAGCVFVVTLPSADSWG